MRIAAVGILRAAAWAAAFAAAGVAGVNAQTRPGATQQAAVDPPLATNPHVLRALAGLGENQAVRLGEARVVGDLNAVARRFELHRTGPLGRDFSIKMVWAPERRRALFVGANHGRPHRLNDVWEFDLGALTWVALYGPDNPRSYRGLGADASDVRYRDGILVTERGGPAVIGHTWWAVTYDPVARRMLYMNVWLTDKETAIRDLGGDPSTQFRGPPLWSFDPQRREWRFLRTPPPAPAAPAGSMLEYAEPLGGAIWHSNHWRSSGTWLYLGAENRWVNLDANAATRDFKAQSPKFEQVGYFDPARRIVVAQNRRDTYHFDVASRQWSRVRSAPDDTIDWPSGHDARAPMFHDPVSGHGLLVQYETNALWAYDPDARSWTRLTPRGDPMPGGSKRLAYFDVEHGVLVVIDGTQVWAYRYRRR